MSADCGLTSTATTSTTGAGPYRRRPAADPELRARLDEALDSARRELGRTGRARRWLTGLAACGYIAGAWVASPSEEAGSGTRIGWFPVAAGATYALFRATRAGVRAHDLDAEIAALERLAETVSRAPR